MHSLLSCHLCVDSGGIAQAAASVSVKFCKSQLTYARTSDVAAAARGLQIVIPTTSQSGFGAEPEVSQDGRTNCAEEAKDAKE